MPHPLVLQLRFTRSEFRRALDGVTDEEAVRRFEPMNCISWIIGHLAWQEQMYWLTRAQGITPVPELDALATFAPGSSPPLAEMWDQWRAITEAADPWLDTLTSDKLLTRATRNDLPFIPEESFGTQFRRTTYHYWFHIGDSQAVRQLLGHRDLPIFVHRDMGEKAPYVREQD